MKKKFIAMLSAFAVTTSLVPYAVFTASAVGHENEVHVIIENTTFTPDSEDWDGSFWSGTLVDTWVALDSGSTCTGCIINALSENGYTQSGAENGYIEEINGLKAYDGGMMSGWMSTINDWFATEGTDAFTVENGRLSEGDEICVMYSCNWGEDIGSVWGNSDTTIKSIGFSNGTLSPDFDKDIHEYTLTLPSDAESVIVRPTASNKNYQVRTRIGDTVYKRTADVPIIDGEEITVECNFEGALSMNSEGEPQAYTFSVVKMPEKQGYSEILSSSVAKLASVVTAPEFGSVGGEWSVLSLARSGYYDKDSAYFSDYYSRITDTVSSTAASVNMNGALHKSKSTENSRLIVALSAVGKSPENVGGWNLLAPYEDFSWISKQGLSGVVWSLIALDTNNYLADSDIRQQCIEYILANQLENGGWAFSGKTADTDMTAIVLQALARYTENEEVKAAVETALGILSATQQESGGYASYGSESAESVAQVVTALTAMGINPETDERFIKNGNSAVDALLAYYDSDSHDFRHTLDGDGNAMATEQAIYALVSYDRLVNGRTPLYDMSDVETEEATTTTTTTTTTATTTETTTTTTTTETTAATTTTTQTTTSTATTTATTTTTTADVLPETGNNDPKNLVVCASALAMTIAGTFMVIASKKKENE